MANYTWPEITKDTPIEEIKRIHQKIWDYVIEHGKKPVDVHEKYFFGCSSCQYAHLNDDYYKTILMEDIFGDIYDAHSFCRKCPIKWLNNRGCTHLNSIYRRWSHEGDFSRKADIAKQIHDLPWKFEMGDADETSME